MYKSWHASIGIHNIHSWARPNLVVEIHIHPIQMKEVLRCLKSFTISAFNWSAIYIPLLVALLGGKSLACDYMYVVQLQITHRATTWSSVQTLVLSAASGQTSHTFWCHCPSQNGEQSALPLQSGPSESQAPHPRPCPKVQTTTGVGSCC